MPPFRFCPACAAELPPAADPGAARTCARCGATHYRNSKPCVGAVIERGGRVLLSKRAVAPRDGEWDLPGGFLEWGEDARAGIVREVREETGLEVEVGEVAHVGVGEYGDERTLNVVFRCVAEGEPRAASDSAEMRWFPLDALPPLAFAHEADAIARVAASRGPLGEVRYLYLGSSDTARDVAHYREAAGARVLWDLTGFGARVAALGLLEGPLVLLADHRAAPSMLPVVEVPSLEEAVTRLRARGWAPKAEGFEIPNGPCAVFEDPSGNEWALFENRRPRPFEES